MGSPSQPRDAHGRFARSAGDAVTRSFDARAGAIKAEERYEKLRRQLLDHERKRDDVATDMDGVRWDRKQYALGQRLEAARLAVKKAEDLARVAKKTARSPRR